MANRTLDVLRHGHVNHFTGDYPSTMSFLKTSLGAHPFREWKTPEAGSFNALISLGPVCLELFAPKEPEGQIGQYLGRRPAGWHSLEWTVPDLDIAAEIVAAAGVRITEGDENYFFTHPKDLGGLALEITYHTFDDDPRSTDGWDVRRGIGGPLGFDGVPEVLIASADPVGDAQRLAALVGGSVVSRQHSGLDAVGAGLHFDDHVVEYVGPRQEKQESAVGRRLAAGGLGIWAVVLPVTDLVTVESTLKDRGVVDFDLATPELLWVASAVNDGAAFAFRQVGR